MSDLLASYEVAIVGGGVMGSSVADWLAREHQASVLVIERDPSYATASSALSASSIRQQFSTPVCVEMSKFGMDLLKNASQHFGEVGGEMGLVERGYLFLAHAERHAILASQMELQRRCGADIAAFSPSRLSEIYPWLETSDIALASLGMTGEGWFDGHSLLQAFKASARSRGVTYCADEVVGFEWAQSRIAAISLGSGRRISVGAVVNAAGPNAGRIARWAGFDLPVAPERRTIFVFDCQHAPQDCPLIIDPSGLYFRPEGRVFIAGGPAVIRHDLDPFELVPDYDQFDDFIWPTLAHRVPAFESIKMLRAWAGHYEMNIFDRNALIGWTPGVDNLMTIAGFSGHGMQHAAAAGRGVAELLLYGGFRTLDLSALSVERLITGVAIAEDNII